MQEVESSPLNDYPLNFNFFRSRCHAARLIRKQKKETGNSVEDVGEHYRRKEC